MCIILKKKTLADESLSTGQCPEIPAHKPGSPAEPSDGPGPLRTGGHRPWPLPRADAGLALEQAPAVSVDSS